MLALSVYVARMVKQGVYTRRCFPQLRILLRHPQDVVKQRYGGLGLRWSGLLVATTVQEQSF